MVELCSKTLKGNFRLWLSSCSQIAQNLWIVNLILFEHSYALFCTLALMLNFMQCIDDSQGLTLNNFAICEVEKDWYMFVFEAFKLLRTPNVLLVNNFNICEFKGLVHVYLWSIVDCWGFQISYWWVILTFVNSQGMICMFLWSIVDSWGLQLCYHWLVLTFVNF